MLAYYPSLFDYSNIFAFAAGINIAYVAFDAYKEGKDAESWGFVKILNNQIERLDREFKDIIDRILGNYTMMRPKVKIVIETNEGGQAEPEGLVEKEKNLNEKASELRGIMQNTKANVDHLSSAAVVCSFYSLLMLFIAPFTKDLNSNDIGYSISFLSIVTFIIILFMVALSSFERYRSSWLWDKCQSSKRFAFALFGIYIVFVIISLSNSSINSSLGTKLWMCTYHSNYHAVVAATICFSSFISFFLVLMARLVWRIVEFKWLKLPKVKKVAKDLNKTFENLGIKTIRALPDENMEIK